MKLLHLVTSLSLVLVGGQGLRPPTETSMSDGDDSLLLVHHSESGHRHGLAPNPHHHDEKRIDAHHESLHHRNLTESSCGDGICSEGEAVRGCPQDCGNLELQASDVGQRGSNGVMFYVKARRDISITSLDFYTGTQTANQEVQVYTRAGKYTNFELNEDGWEIVHDRDSVNLLGGNRPTELGDFDTSVTISEGSFQSFFIWTPKNRIRYKIGTSEGAGYSGNQMIAFYEGVGLTSKFSGSYSENVHSSRVFRGVIKYDAVSSSSFGGDPLISGLQITPRQSCLTQNNQRRVKIEMQTDEYGYETSYTFRKKGGGNPVAQGPDGGKYESSNFYAGTICVDVGMYEFEIKDLFKDGLEGDGYYSVSVQDENGTWKTPVRGSKFAASKTHVVDVGQTESKMTVRDKEYLEAHNKRRKEWHARYNKEYVPIKWSNGLKEHAMPYAVKLLETCQTEQPKHDPTNPYGENLARNQGPLGLDPQTGVPAVNFGWGQRYPPDNIVYRFVEREEGWPWASNAHLTNVIWRATKYVGCAEAEKSYVVTNARKQKVTHHCRVQVCRYAKPGNCSMAKYKFDNGVNDWETPMLMDDSPCKPDCPPEDCYDE